MNTADDHFSDDLRAKLDDLEARLERVEYHLGLSASRAVAAPPAKRSVSMVEEQETAELLKEKVEAMRRVLHANAERPTLPTVGALLTVLPSVPSSVRALNDHPPTSLPVVMPSVSGAPPTPPPIPGFTTPVAPPVRLSKPKAKSDLSIESLIGGKFFLGVGALILVVGVAFGLKLGVEKGWFSVSPLMRSLGASGFGVALVGLGEYLRRRINVLASTGLFAAGIAINFSAVYAAWSWYGLIGSAAAFVLLAIVCVLGVGIGLIGSSLAIGVLSLVGAYCTPLIFQSSGASPLVMPGYLLSLLALGLALAGWKPVPFRALRLVAWWGTVLLGSGWLVSSGRHHEWIGLGFLGLTWLMIHVELLVGSAREPEARTVPMGPLKQHVRVTRPVVSSFATTLWCVAMGTLLAQMTTVIPAWSIPMAGVVGTLCLAMVLAGNLRIFRDHPESDRERLGAGLWMQSAGLLIVTTALALSGWTQVVAWLGMALAAMAAGRWLRARSLDVYGLTLLVIAVARLVVYDSWNTPTGGAEVFGAMLTRWSLLVFLASSAWLAASWMISRAGESVSSKRRHVTDVAIAVGLSLLAVSTFTQDSLFAAILGTSAIVGALIALAAGLRESRILQAWSVMLLAFASVAAAVLQLGDMVEPVVVARLGSVLVTHGGLGLLVCTLSWWATVVAFRPFRAVQDRIGRGALVGIGMVFFLLIWCAPGSSLKWASAIWAASGAACFVLPLLVQPLRSFMLDLTGVGTLLLASVMWAAAFTMKSSWNAETAVVGLHPGLWLGCAIVAVLLGVSFMLKQRHALSCAGVRPTAATSAALVLLVATSLEVARGALNITGGETTSQRAAVSIWWGIFGVGLIVVGFWRTVAPTRHAGLALLAIATAKAVIFDLADVGPEWRVASFIGLGLLMLGVAVGYARISKRLSRATPTPEPHSDPIV
jgi:uncharacterized membrane protein